MMALGVKALGVGLIAVVVGGALGLGQAAPHERVIAGYATPLGGRMDSQRHNARLAVDGLDGAVVGPGEEFSFNRRVGSFSRDAGYRKAPVSYNGQLISSWGGGVCQASTTLYNAALLAGMKIVERNRHHFAPSYVPPGRDAAVAFSNIDLRFVNPHPFAVRIRAGLEAERLRVEILGNGDLPVRPVVVEEVRHVQSPATFELGRRHGPGRVRNTGKAGYDVTVYRITDDRKELISTDSYPAMGRVVQYEETR